ncbi:MAG: type II toxin-antitoxin system RelE/ParE family toxin [Sedimenticola sp.]
MDKKLILSNQAVKAVDNLQAKQYRQVVRRILGLQRETKPHDSSQLKGQIEYRRIDQGEFRIIYREEEDTVYVIVVDKRNDDTAYRALNRLR